MPIRTAKHIDNLKENIGGVRRIIEIHEELTGKKPGYKHNVEVLNKGAIVLLVACWEAFIEDLAYSAFDFMLSKASSYKVFPMEVLTRASRELKDSNDGREVWRLAENGWKEVLIQHKKVLCKRYLGNFNTPKPEQIDELFACLLGMSKISNYWHWKSMSVEGSRKKLSTLVSLRGSIAHRVSATRAVRKSDVKDYINFIFRLAVISSNRVADYLLVRLKIKPWQRYVFQKTS